MLEQKIFKNLTPYRLSLYGAGISALFSGLMYFLIALVLDAEIAYPVLALLVVTIGVFGYFLIKFILERYIYRRVKLIYKTIRQSKMSTPAKTLRISQENSILDQVEEEVADWAEAQHKEIETLKTLEAYRRKFLGDVSHELKTPIFSIQGYIHTLLDGGLHDENINMKYLERAARNVDRLLTIVQDLEAISKLETGDLILEIQRFDIKELGQEVFLDLELVAKEKSISMRFKEGADQGFKVKGDRDYIRQVLTNLILNSIKYGKEGGQTKVSLYDMDKHILVEVSDNGLGVEEQHLKHLFDRFYRVDKSRSRESGGSGLGLSIVKHILEAHNQTINVRSTPGLGSTFGFTLEKA